MRSIKTILQCIAVVAASSITNVWAHGERSLEPFVRMRTIQWYDVTWSETQVKINDALTISGRFHVAEDWPNNLLKPDLAYLGVIAPGPVLVRKEHYINGEPYLNSLPLQLGRDYEFKMVLKARVPGRFHIHPSFNVKDTGNITGPGQWIEITGAAQDFTNPITTVEGATIDLETFGTANAVGWHMFWMISGVAWLLWWLRRPLFLPRYAMMQAGLEGELVTPTDRTIAKVILIAVPLIVSAAYFETQRQNPHAIPLQAAVDQIEPEPLAPTPVKAKVERAIYRVLDRALTMKLRVINEGPNPIQIGEFITGPVRFLNSAVNIDRSGYPETYIAKSGLHIEPDGVISPGETKTIEVTATDSLWETERLASVIRDADSRFGGLLFFYDSEGGRHRGSVFGPLIPDFS